MEDDKNQKSNSPMNTSRSSVPIISLPLGEGESGPSAVATSASARPAASPKKKSKLSPRNFFKRLSLSPRKRRESAKMEAEEAASKRDSLRADDALSTLSPQLVDRYASDAVQNGDIHEKGAAARHAELCQQRKEQEAAAAGTGTTDSTQQRTSATSTTTTSTTETTSKANGGTDKLLATTDISIKLLRPRQLAAAASLLARAHADLDFWRCIMSADATHDERVAHLQDSFFPRLVKYFVRRLNTGAWGAFYGDELVGCMLWSPPEHDGKVPTSSKLTLKNWMRRHQRATDGVLKEYRVRVRDKKHWALLYLAVEPAYQRQGIGSHMVQQVLRWADNEELPCFCHTFDSGAANFLQRLGFRVLAEGLVAEAAADSHGDVPWYIQQRRVQNLARLSTASSRELSADELPPSRVASDDVGNGGTKATSSAATTTTAATSSSPVPSATMSAAKFVIRPQDLRRDVKIGEGAHGIVYKGVWRNVKVAIKEVKFVSNGPQLESFKREAERLAKLVPHPNVVAFYGVCETPNFSIVYKYYTNGGLDRYLYGKPARDTSDELCMRWVRGISYGVQHLHAERIVHRDLAARNVLLGENFNALITDFGMARDFAADLGDSGRMLSTSVEERMATTSSVGPIRWMAPEQLESLRYSTQSDVYSYGVLLYEIFKRERPWEGVAVTKVCALVMSGRTLDVPSSAVPGIGDVMRACWRMKPRERPSMSEVVAMVDAIRLDDDDDDDDDEEEEAEAIGHEFGGFSISDVNPNVATRAADDTANADNTYGDVPGKVSRDKHRAADVTTHVPVSTPNKFKPEEDVSIDAFGYGDIPTLRDQARADEAAAATTKAKGGAAAAAVDEALVIPDSFLGGAKSTPKRPQARRKRPGDYDPDTDYGDIPGMREAKTSAASSRHTTLTDEELAEFGYERLPARAEVSRLPSGVMLASDPQAGHTASTSANVSDTDSAAAAAAEEEEVVAVPSAAELLEMHKKKDYQGVKSALSRMSKTERKDFQALLAEYKSKKKEARKSANPPSRKE